MRISSMPVDFEPSRREIGSSGANLGEKAMRPTVEWQNRPDRENYESCARMARATN